jgi:uncharacterized protein (DUF2147 family)|tara:strand:+ start:2113 stop:2604 length:492 start_codon:yes stop_codon:yes gene_type:complete
MKLLNILITRKKLLFFSFFCSFILQAEKVSSIEGYWLTSASIVEVKKCKDELCATIVHIFVEEGVDPKSILDSNNKKKSLRSRPLVGINLLEGFKYSDNKKNLIDGKIYDPGRGRVFKSNLYVLDNGNLKVEGCFMGICGHEEWKRLKVIINNDGTRSAELLN